MTAADTLALLDWKRRVFALYEDVRTMEPEEGWKLWRETRDELFRSHPQSPRPRARAGFEGLEFCPYDPEARVLAELEDVDAPPQAIETSGVEPMLFRPFARAYFELRGERLSLEVDWLDELRRRRLPLLPRRDERQGDVRRRALSPRHGERRRSRGR